MLALPPAPAPARPRQMLVGTALAAGATAMLVMGQLAAYVSIRKTEGSGLTTEWLPDGVVINEIASNTMLITLLCTSVMAQWAVYAMHRGDRRNAGIALVLTVLFGAAAINAQVFIWSGWGVAFATVYGTLVYTITGTFVAVLAAMVLMAGVMAFRSFGGRYSPKDTEGLSATALFVHATTVMFCAVWYVIYVLK